MHSVESYCRRLPTEKLEQALRDHDNGTEIQQNTTIELIKDILAERKEEHG